MAVGRIIQAARVPSGQVPAVAALYTVANPNVNFVRGALVVSTAGLIDLCGADPVLIAGVAMADANTNPGYNAANTPATITGREQRVSVAVANNVTVFSSTLTNASAVRIAPLQSDVAVQYGVTAYAGVWTVDKAKTAGTARVVITDVDLYNNIVYFKFLPANIQIL